MAFEAGADTLPVRLLFFEAATATRRPAVGVLLSSAGPADWFAYIESSCSRWRLHPALGTITSEHADRRAL